MLVERVISFFVVKLPTFSTDWHDTAADNVQNAGNCFSSRIPCKPWAAAGSVAVCRSKYSSFHRHAIVMPNFCICEGCNNLSRGASCHGGFHVLIKVPRQRYQAQNLCQTPTFRAPVLHH